MRMDEGTRKQIIIGVLVALVVMVVVQPLLGLLWRLLLFVSSRTWYGVVDLVYRRACRASPVEAGTAVGPMLLGTIVIVISFGLSLQLAFSSLPDEYVHKRMRRVMRLGWLGLALVLFSFLGADFTAGVRGDFRNRLAVLAPAIDEQQEEDLVARWVQVRSRADYVGLNADMDRLAEQAGVELPKAKW